MPKLVIQEGDQQSVFELFEDEATIGRGAASGIQVVDSRASKHHAVVRRVGGRIKLVDLESKNGTRVNGEFRNQRWLAGGDVITIGDLHMRFEDADAPAAVAQARPALQAAALVSAPAAAPSRAVPEARPTGGGGGGGARAGSRRDRERDREGDDDDRDRRGGRRKSDNSALVAVGMGAAALVVGTILFWMLSHSGAGVNARAQQAAKRLYAEGKHDEALALLEKEGDPSRPDEYRSVQELIDTWRAEKSHEGDIAKAQQAMDIYRKIEFDRIEQHKNHLTDVQLEIGRASCRERV